jgi:hypothetical protein
MQFLPFHTVDELPEAIMNIIEAIPETQLIRLSRCGDGDWNDASSKKDTTLNTQNQILLIIFPFNHGKWIHPDSEWTPCNRAGHIHPMSYTRS